MIDKIRELTGIYGWGFDPESVLGLLLPVGFFVIFGVIPAAIILLLRR